MQSFRIYEAKMPSKPIKTILFIESKYKCSHNRNVRIQTWKQPDQKVKYYFMGLGSKQSLEMKDFP